MRILVLDSPETIKFELEKIGVDTRAFPIFSHKGETLAIKLFNLTCAQANVIKQISLSLGADCAIHRDVIKGEKKISDGIIFANRRQIEKILNRMVGQNFLSEPLKQIEQALMSYEQRPAFKIGDKVFDMDRTYIMGVINVTPDSFYQESRSLEVESAIEKALSMAESGADFIDIGAESTRPGSDPLEAKEEIERLKPILGEIVNRVKIPVSIDTYKAEVARFALDNGVSIINDISALTFDQKMIEVVAKSDVGVILMHIKGRPKTMQDNPAYENLMEEIYSYFRERMEFLRSNSIETSRIAVDPGLGFGKRLNDNYTIIKRMKELKVLGRPILAGPSRKSFVGIPFGLPPEERLEGTLGLLALLIERGVNILRVHDVIQAKRVAQLIDLLLKSNDNG